MDGASHRMIFLEAINTYSTAKNLQSTIEIKWRMTTESTHFLF